jgi:L-histidine Nalpha-methyltransferase
MAADVRAGLTSTPPTISPRWLYDEVGSRLFDQITMLPEYYPTRRETEILSAHSDQVARTTGATTLIELGSGTSTKTRLLVEAFVRHLGRLQLVPLDVSVEVLVEAAHALERDYPSVTVRPVAADFEEALPALPGELGRRLVLFLGGTIGNLDEHARHGFFGRLRAALSPGDHLLIGADLVKDVDRLVAAYDDAAGVTAEFNRNVIRVLARELAAEGLSAEHFDHVARWNAEDSRIEMWLRARRDVHARLAAAHDLRWDLPAGGEVRTEISVKFDLQSWRQELEAHGFRPVHSWTDSAGDFSVTLSRLD